MVVCDADLLFINICVRWPGSVHDARILRESPLFQSFESPRKPLEGMILGDSGYMLRDWLMTPLQNPGNRNERHYNFAHSSTRSTIERCIGVTKRRWNCLRSGLRLEPVKCCQVITVCFMLHNRATRLRLDPPEHEDEGRDHDDHDKDDDNDDYNRDDYINGNERARRNAGQGVRQRLINNFF